MRNQRKEACNKVDHKAGGQKTFTYVPSIQRILDGAMMEVDVVVDQDGSPKDGGSSG